MKTRFQKYAIGQWLVVMLLLSLVNVSATWATDRDSLQKAHIAASVKQLNRAITHNTLKKPTVATKYLVDRLNYVSTGAQERIEKVLEYLQKNTGKELYVIITRNPDLVNENNATAKFQKEIKAYSQAVFKNSLLGEKGGLYTFNFGRIITKAKFGVQQSFQQGISLANGSDWNTAEVLDEQTTRRIQESSKSLDERDDFLKANLYALVSKMLNAAGDKFDIDFTQNPSHQKNLDFEAIILGVSNTNAAGSALIVDLPTEIDFTDKDEEKLKANYVFTPSGQAIYWPGMTKMKFWKRFNGSLLEFTYKEIHYVAVMSRPQFTRGDNEAYTRFWGYYPEKEFNDLKTREDREGLPLATIVNKKTVLAKEFNDNLWFDVRAEKNKTLKVYVRKYKGVELDPKELFSDAERKKAAAFKNLTFKTNCIEAYAWLHNPTTPVYKRGEGSIQANITIPANSEKRVGNCETLKLINEDVKNRKLTKSWGVYIYASQIQDVKDDEAKRQALVDYANKMSAFLKIDKVGLINFEKKFEGRGSSGNHYTIQREQILLALRKIDYETFKATYSSVIPKARVSPKGGYDYTMLAQYNPFSQDYEKGKVPQIPGEQNKIQGRNKEYNRNTRDYRVKDDKKVKQDGLPKKVVPYRYSVQDLVKRHQVFVARTMNGRYASQLLDDEIAGIAYPLSIGDDTEQYKALYGTNSAVFAWFSFLKNSVGGAIEKTGRVVKAVSDELAKLIGKAAIPKHWWNPPCEKRAPQQGKDNCNACKGTYPSVLTKIFSTLKEETAKPLQIEFAYFAGMWNGIIGQAQGTFQLISLVSDYFSNPQMRQVVRDMKKKLEEKGLWKVLGEEVDKATCNDFVSSYNAGKTIVDVAFVVISAPKSVANALSKLKGFVKALSKTTFKILQQTKKIAAKVKNGVIKVTQVTRQGAKDAFNILAKKGGIDEVIAVVENGRLRVKKWVDARNNKKSISESIDGTHCVGETPKGDVGICLKNGACFVAGTPIYLANQFKPIEQINTLDTVQAGNPKNCEQVLKGVEATFVRTTPVLVKLDFPLENIYATPEHPFFDLKNRQVLAGNIKKGDTLKTYDGYAIVQNTRSIDTTATVYNFHVKDFHTYYVGRTKLWVHNMASHLLVTHVNGRKNLTADFAGKEVTTTSGYTVKVKDNGFADFTPEAKKSVLIDNIEGNYDLDFAKANAEAFPDIFEKYNLTINDPRAINVHKWDEALKSVDADTKKEWTWHHHEDTKTMQLVPAELNNSNMGGLSHTGGVAVLKHNANNPGNELNLPSPIHF